jgi:hypothetical protein
MQIVPKSGPAVIQPATSTANAQPSARDRAIAMLQGPQQQHEAVRNPSQVAPEELSAVQPPSQPQETSQNHSGDSESTEQAPEVKQAPKAADPLSNQYALLARKEKALRAKVQAQDAATRAREQDLLAREEAIKAKESEYQSNYIPKSRFKADPLAVLTEEGVSYDEITKAILNPQAQQDPRILHEIEKLKAELRETKETQNKAQKSYEEQKRQDYQQAVHQIRTDVKQLVITDPNFETIKETNSVSDVVELIEKTFKSDGILLSVEEAAREVEEYLVDEALKLHKISKIRNRLQSAQAPASAKKQAPQQAQPSQPKTLTNSVNASKKLSARERAIAAFKGELK